MPLKKLQLKAGINRETSAYTSEGGWYDCDKVRFRSGVPEKIGGWERISNAYFLGVCRSLHKWTTLGASELIGVGTNEKFYIARGAEYYDITPIRETTVLTNPFTTTNGSSTVTVTDAISDYTDGDYVTFTGSTEVAGLTITGEYKLTETDANQYTITVDSNANASTTGGGTVTAEYQLNVGEEYAIPIVGWASGTWSSGSWANSSQSIASLRLWSQFNFGEDLLFGYEGSELFYWDVTDGVETRAVKLGSLSGASEVPLKQNITLVSDVSRFVFCFGTNPLFQTELDPMLVRWSDQEDAVNWNPAATNQAGSLRLSKGTRIVAATQARQEVLVWTDTTLYSLQYVGAPIVWGAQTVGDNVSIVSKNAVAYANGTAFWMGYDKFYTYDGRTQTLPCDVRKYVFDDFNNTQRHQVFSGTNERFGEVWWWYCSSGSTIVDKYVVYNYVDQIWYYGTMNRTAWLDNAVGNRPVAATYTKNLTQHEVGCDNKETPTTAPITAYITSAQFDLDDGHQFMFIHRLIPDLQFLGSTTQNPSVAMTMLPLKNSGSGYTNPASVGGNSSQNVIRSSTVIVEEYTEQLFVRVRGRQMAIKVESTGEGVQWQVGSARLDMRPDGRR